MQRIFSLSSSFSRYELEIEHTNIDLGARTQPIVIKNRRPFTVSLLLFRSSLINLTKLIDSIHIPILIDSYFIEISFFVRRYIFVLHFTFLRDEPEEKTDRSAANATFLFDKTRSFSSIFHPYVSVYVCLRMSVV